MKKQFFFGLLIFATLFSCKKEFVLDSRATKMYRIDLYERNNAFIYLINVYPNGYKLLISAEKLDSFKDLQWESKQYFPKELISVNPTQIIYVNINEIKL